MCWSWNHLYFRIIFIDILVISMLEKRRDYLPLLLFESWVKMGTMCWINSNYRWIKQRYLNWLKTLSFWPRIFILVESPFSLFVMNSYFFTLILNAISGGCFIQLLHHTVEFFFPDKPSIISAKWKSFDVVTWCSSRATFIMHSRA